MAVWRLIMDFEKIKSAVEGLTKDEGAKAEFMKNPVETLEKRFGVDLPDEQIKSFAETLKSKLDADGDGTPDILESLKGVIGKADDSGIADKIKGLFSK